MRPCFNFEIKKNIEASYIITKEVFWAKM